MMERLERIKNKWMPDDGFGIGHPIYTDVLEEDVRYLVGLIENLKSELEEIKENTSCSHTKDYIIRVLKDYKL